VCNNVDIDRSLNQDQIYDLFSNLFKEYLDRFTWNEGDKRFVSVFKNYLHKKVTCIIIMSFCNDFLNQKFIYMWGWEVPGSL